MQNSFDMTTLVFLALAVFVAWKLRSVLGQKTGIGAAAGRSLRPPRGAAAPGPTSRERKRDNVIRLPGAANDPTAPEPCPAAERWKGIAPPDSPIIAGIEAVIRAGAGLRPARLHRRRQGGL